MANKFELTIDLTNRKFVTSRYDSSTFSLDKLYQGDVLPLRIRLVTPKEDGGLTSPFDLVTAGSIELAIVTPNSSSPAVLATTSATSISADGSDYYADCTLDLNTSEIDGLTYAGNTSPATTTIEAEYINGGNNLTAIQQAISIQPHGIDSGASAPSPSSSYYTQTQTDANFLAKSGGTMSGVLALSNASKLKFQHLNDTAITGAGNHTLNPNNAAFIKIGSLSADANLVGISGGEDGRFIIIYNSSTSNNLIIRHDSSDESSAANRIYTMTGNDVTISARGSFNCIYDAEDDRWIILSLRGTT
tara:strand:- start:4765 stop:5676 length:912 start_codon:yes stop_codon:yes gene_type:complete